MARSDGSALKSFDQLPHKRSDDDHSVAMMELGGVCICKYIYVYEYVVYVETYL